MSETTTGQQAAGVSGALRFFTLRFACASAASRRATSAAASASSSSSPGESGGGRCFRGPADDVTRCVRGDGDALRGVPRSRDADERDDTPSRESSDELGTICVSAHELDRVSRGGDERGGAAPEAAPAR